MPQGAEESGDGITKKDIPNAPGKEWLGGSGVVPGSSWLKKHTPDVFADATKKGKTVVCNLYRGEKSSWDREPGGLGLTPRSGHSSSARKKGRVNLRRDDKEGKDLCSRQDKGGEHGALVQVERGPIPDRRTLHAVGGKGDRDRAQ